MSDQSRTFKLDKRLTGFAVVETAGFPHLLLMLVTEHVRVCSSTRRIHSDHLLASLTCGRDTRALHRYILQAPVGT